MAVAGRDSGIDRVDVVRRKTNSAQHFEIAPQKCSEEDSRDLRVNDVQTDAAARDSVHRKNRDAVSRRPQADDHVASLPSGTCLDDDDRSAGAGDRDLDVVSREKAHRAIAPASAGDRRRIARDERHRVRACRFGSRLQLATMHRAKVRHVECVRDGHVPRAVEIDRCTGFEAERVGIDRLKIRNGEERKLAGMDEDHPVAFGHDVASTAVLPMMQRTADAIADDCAVGEIDALMQTVSRQRADDAIVTPAKENDRKVTEVEAENRAWRERFRRGHHVPPRNDVGWPRGESL